jgi:hypothetical protein
LFAKFFERIFEFGELRERTDFVSLDDSRRYGRKAGW